MYDPYRTNCLIFKLFILASIVFLAGFFTLNVWAEVTSLTPVCRIQGKNETSPYWGDVVITRGVVYADQDNTSRRGFYIQKENCDSEPATSDGIFVYLGEAQDIVSQGDLVEVRGRVDEYYGLTELKASEDGVSVISIGNILPKPVSLNPPFDIPSAREYYETFEGMHVKVEDALTVGPTDASARSWVVRSELGIGRVFSDDPRGTGEIVCVGDGGNFKIDPQVKVGDRIFDLRGALDYEVGEYCMQLFNAPAVIPSFQASKSAGIGEAFSFRMSTFNLANLFDTNDDPSKDDTVISAAEYQHRLQKRALAIHEVLIDPELIAVQEVENAGVLQAFINRPELAAGYGYVWEDGPDIRGLDVALLYRLDRVKVMSSQVRQSCTTLLDGLGPDGNGDVHNPGNAVTCDTNQDGLNDGNRLFSRPPLIVRLKICQGACNGPYATPEWIEFWMVINHLKSKIEDSTDQAYTLPRRIQQAQFVAALVEEIRLDYQGANIFVLGDLNDFPGSQPLSILQDAGLQNTIFGIPALERYTYIFQGISQSLDYILIDLKLPFACTGVTPTHINADYPVSFEIVSDSFLRSSDHDLLTIQIKELVYFLFMPEVHR